MFAMITALTSANTKPALHARVHSTATQQSMKHRCGLCQDSSPSESRLHMQ